jgi:membrane-associated phospholipid phosphatase
MGYQMEPLILEAGIEVVLFLQGLGDWLLPPMIIFTLLGHEVFYLLGLLVIYWSINSRAGVRIALVIMISGSINYLFKIALASPRPYWYDPRVRALAVETTFGVPSGHAQTAIPLWGTMAYSVKKPWAWAGVAVLVLFIGLSRLYLGVHFPHDVLAGWLFGLIILFGYLRFEAKGKAWLDKIEPKYRILLAFIFSLTMILAAFLVRLSLGPWTVPELWAVTAAQAAPDAGPLEPLGFSNVISGAGAFFGLAVGAIHVMIKGGFSAQGVWWKRALRFPIGLIGILLLMLGPGSLIPEAGILAPVIQYLHFAILGFWVTGLGPRLFIRLKLASSNPVVQ